MPDEIDDVVHALVCLGERVLVQELRLALRFGLCGPGPLVPAALLAAGSAQRASRRDKGLRVTKKTISTRSTNPMGKSSLPLSSGSVVPAVARRNFPARTPCKPDKTNTRKIFAASQECGNQPPWTASMIPNAHAATIAGDVTTRSYVLSCLKNDRTGYLKASATATMPPIHTNRATRCAALLSV